MIINYVKIAYRNIFQNKVYTIVNVSGLSIAIAVVLLISLYIKDDLSFDRFHENGNEVYRIVADIKDSKGELRKSGNTGHIQGPIFKDQVPEIESYCRIKNGWNTLVKLKEDALVEDLIYADSSFFSIFTFDALAGDLHTSLNDINSVVISDRISDKYFGKADPIGQLLYIGDEASEMLPYQVTAVVKHPPSNSSLQFDLICSFDGILARDSHYANNTSWGNANLNTFVKLRDDANISALSSKMDVITNSHIKSEIDNNKKEGKDVWQYSMKFHLQPLYGMHLDDQYFASNGLQHWSSAKYPKIMFGLSMLLLAIACINFINLSLARSLRRNKEIGIRKTIGGTRWQLFYQFMSEAFLMTLCAALPALLMAYWFLPAFSALTDKYFYDGILFAPETLIAFTGLILLVAMLAGGYPALVMSGFKPLQSLQGKSLFGSRQTLRQSLVVLQFTLAGILLLGTVFLTRQFNFINSVPLGYKTENRVRIWLPWEELGRISHGFKREIAQLPYVESVSAKSGDFNKTKFMIEGEETDWIYYEHVDDNHLQLLDIPLVAGRYFSYDFAMDTVSNIIVNESFVRTILPNVKDPLLSPIKLRDQMTNIVGVVKDFHYASFKEKIEPIVFMLDKDNQGLLVHAKVAQGHMPEAILGIKSIYKKYVPFLPIEYELMEDHRMQQYSDEIREKQIVTYTSGIAIIIACLGLFGLATFITEQRTKEIGIRKVLGAGVTHITALLSGDFLKLVAISFILSIPIAYYLTDLWLQNFSYRIEMDWWIFSLVALIIMSLAFLTVSYQTIRAAISNPIDALKSE